MATAATRNKIQQVRKLTVGKKNGVNYLIDELHPSRMEMTVFRK